jgi:threonine dehydratase
VLYRFEFPERPGALLNFLETLRSDWNISLFHYRNHGADFGRVLVGMQVPPADRSAFDEFLARLGYEYVDETANPAYKMSSADPPGAGELPPRRPVHPGVVSPPTPPAPDLP